MSRCRLVLAAIALSLMAQSAAYAPPRIAIIIDDLGYQLAAGRRAIDLPGPLAFAVLPQTPKGELLATIAHDKGKEVLLHLPLEPVEYSGPAEPGGILLDMSRATFRNTFAGAIESVPFAIGVSSHRGSLLTRHPGHMAWLMEELLDRDNLFFVDSYTTHESVALKVAAEAGVAATKRDVFLDHDRSADAVSREFERLKSLARQSGQAVGIGHPYPATLDFLEREIPKLEKQGYKLVSISQMLLVKQDLKEG
ncbi:MAG: divergent polysaccharide deacetylase family protein [Desulfobulbaceae bacterium]|nr:divergent polysaccharide deacetylase family protein [Desulfobulbaceae bacterium]